MLPWACDLWWNNLACCICSHHCDWHRGDVVIYKALGHHTVLIDICCHSDAKNINLNCNIIWVLDSDKTSCLLEVRLIKRSNSVFYIGADSNCFPLGMHFLALAFFWNEKKDHQNKIFALVRRKKCRFWAYFSKLLSMYRIVKQPHEASTLSLIFYCLQH